MPGGRHYIMNDPSQDQAKTEFPVQHESFMAVKRALCTNVDMTNSAEVASREQAIAHFYQSYLAHEMNSYFASWHKHFLERPDSLIQAASLIHE